MTIFTEMPRTGAAATRRVAKKNPMQALVDLLDSDPTANADRLFRKWWPVILADDDYLIAVGRHAFANFLTSLDRDRRRGARQTSNTEMHKERQAAARRLTKHVHRIVLLDLMLPNGKKLRESTFAECSAAGGWFKMVAAKGRPSEIVGQVLNEGDLRKL